MIKRKKIVNKKTEVKEIKIKAQPKNLTAEEAAIFQRIRSEDREWETISEDETIDFSLSDDPFKLPEEAIKLRDDKKFAFRWVERSKERIDAIRNLQIPRKWWIVNASTVPELANKIDPILGCVCLLDQLLVFKPYWMYEAENKMKMEIAESKDQAGDLKSKDKIKVDESGSEFLSGKQHKIGKADEVQLHETGKIDADGTVVFEPGDDSLGNIVEK